MTSAPRFRLTQYAHGGGCACKIPPGELEEITGRAGAAAEPGPARRARDGDDAAVVRIDGGRAMVSTADFFTPVVDDAYDFGPDRRRQRPVRRLRHGRSSRSSR